MSISKKTVRKSSIKAVKSVSKKAREVKHVITSSLMESCSPELRRFLKFAESLLNPHLFPNDPILHMTALDRKKFMEMLLKKVSRSEKAQAKAILDPQTFDFQAVSVKTKVVSRPSLVVDSDFMDEFSEEQPDDTESKPLDEPKDNLETDGTLEDDADNMGLSSRRLSKRAFADELIHTNSREVFPEDESDGGCEQV